MKASPVSYGERGFSPKAKKKKGSNKRKSTSPITTMPNLVQTSNKAIRSNDGALYPRQHTERSEKTGVWGRIPQEVR
jgi:hypothetical protein